MAIRYLVHDEKTGDHLPVTDEDGKPNHRLMGAAWAALHGGYRGNQYQGPHKQQAIAALKALYESEGMDLPSDTHSTFAFAAPIGAMQTTGVATLPILVTGAWVKNGREVTFTKGDLEIAIANFQKLANHDLNVDYDHASEELQRAEGGPTPSAGRIISLNPPVPFRGGGARTAATAGNGERWILYGTYEPTAKARELIAAREYRYTSAAFTTHYADRQTGEDQGLTLTSVALTNQPFLDELPEIWLSLAGIRDTGHGTRESPNPVSRNPDPENLPRLSAERSPAPDGAGQGGTMAKLTLKCSADGRHEANDGDRKVGEIDNDHLYAYAAKHVGKEGPCVEGNLSARGAGHDPEAYATFAREVGAEGRSKEEIRGLVTLALHPLKAEVTLLAEAIGPDGKLDNRQLDVLDDSGKISRSAWRRAKEAEQRVQNAFQRGQVTPAMMATGAPLRLALADGAAFKALIEDRPPLVRTHSVVGIGGSGAETGESPRQLFSRLVEEKKQQLMQTDARLSELEAHRKAGALVAKENPDLLKNYRADAKSA